MADFDPNSASFGVWPTNGFSLSRSNILRNRFFHYGGWCETFPAKWSAACRVWNEGRRD